ncbi:hypothetical protein [Hydrogenophaga sp.]|uniref:hypothetical protein n=1 Tax=Hydrogenophaga sp. TaxID=1904254 RepID=UPI002715E67E|nr:hypothetical protein [Hydrogenophaga sp.]MDO8906838.1 hypothetical protein [Hydrogenophaga sp.]
MFVFFAALFAGTFPAMQVQAATWSVDGTLALTSSYFPKLKALRNVTFSIDWDRQSNCKPTVNVYFMDGDELGSFKSVKKASERMRVKIGEKVWTGDTLLAEHSGGYAMVFYAQDDLVKKIPTASSIAVKVFTDAPWLDFDGRGSESALARAKANCR